MGEASRPLNRDVRPQMPTRTAGYSGTPLAAKLGLKAGSHLLVRNPPDGYERMLQPLPAGMVFVGRLSKATDIVHIFSTRTRELEEHLVIVKKGMRADATIWASWPKKASKVATDISEDSIRDIALPMGLVDVKVCAVDDVWFGLKLVIRKELR